MVGIVRYWETDATYTQRSEANRRQKHQKQAAIRVAYRVTGRQRMASRRTLECLKAQLVLDTLYQSHDAHFYHGEIIVVFCTPTLPLLSLHVLLNTYAVPIMLF